jgi:hypothetical protein
VRRYNTFAKRIERDAKICGGMDGEFTKIPLFMGCPFLAAEGILECVVQCKNSPL